MSFLPALPGFSPVSYGQTYGDWHQYAGYGKDNAFGASPTMMPQVPPAAPSAAPAMSPDTGVMPKADYSLAGAVPPGPFGAKATGMAVPVTPGLAPQAMQNKPMSLAEQASKYNGEQDGD